MLQQWAGVLPEGHILKVRDARAITDVLLGALAVANGRESLDGYADKLTGRGAEPQRVDEVRTSLAGVRSLV